MSSLVKIVNGMIKKSFGRNFFGNHDPIIDPLCMDQIRGPELKYISRRTWLPIPFLCEDYEMIGEFQKKDGSRMMVKEQYAESAKKYARLYEQAYGKKAEIILVKPVEHEGRYTLEVTDKINFDPVKGK